MAIHREERSKEMIQCLHWIREYDIKGQRVHAEVTEGKQLLSGAVEVTVETSCLASDGEVHHQTNSCTLTDPAGGVQLETFMQNCADWLRKLLWEKPRITFFVAELESSAGKWLNLSCTFNIRQTFSAIHPDGVEIAGLPQVGTFVPPENQRITFPIHRARLRFGKRIIDSEVLAVKAGALCVIGSNLILQVAGENSRYLYDLFMSDIVRALSGAARSKQRTVLILGSYSGAGKERLGHIRAALGEEGLQGAILDDFVDIQQQSLFEKMLMFGSLARFLICDESEASGHLIELKACADIGFVTAILRNRGNAVTWMNSDIAADRTYMKICPYSETTGIGEAVKEAVKWAQNKVDERARYYNEHYPWRNPSIQLA